jgi:hypothetical protein
VAGGEGSPQGTESGAGQVAWAEVWRALKVGLKRFKAPRVSG